MVKLNKEFVKEKVSLAKELVEEIDEPFKTNAFLAVLIKLLDSDKKIEHVQQQTESLGKSNDTNSHEIDVIGREGEFAKKCGISLEELKNVVSINKDKVVLLPTLFEGTEANKQVNAAQCVIICEEMLLGREWTHSHIILDCLNGIGIFDHNRNLAKNLRNRTEFFIKHPKLNEYKLTIPKGRNSAFEIIKKLAKGELIK